MSFIHNISTVSKYEARTLRRSWFFRLFSIGAMFIFTFMNIGVFSPVGEEDWMLISIPASVPLINLYLLNIGQAIVVIFLAADFLKRDKKLDTNEVLYTRSMSNFEYIIGKTWGILRLFLGLDLVILSLGLLMNIISTKMTVDIMSYVYYLLIISVPTLLFSLGLAFLMMSAIKNQAITFLLLLGIAALDMFYLWFRAGSIFDYMAFGLPVYRSTIVGFDDLIHILNQRLLYFFLGSALVMGTVLLFKRLPQSKLHTTITIIFLFLFLGGACITGFNTYSSYTESVRSKRDVIEANRKYENSLFSDITSENIELVHNGETIKAAADITLTNNNGEPLQKYIFSLNPGLSVLSVSARDRKLNFLKTNHIIEVEPLNILEPGKSDTITITYEGAINESFCYPDYSDNIKQNPYRIAMVNVNKRQAFLESNYVLLTPETHWYPVASLNYYPSDPARIKIDFTNFTLKVKDEPGMIPVSQGRLRSTEGYSIFTPSSPLTGITLGIGNYVTDTLRIDSVEYLTYHFPGHDYYKKDLMEIKDTLTYLVSGIMRELETNFSTKYPFSSLSLMEVPVQFHSYPRENTQTRAELQPSMILVPEKLSTLRGAGFSKQFAQQKKRMARNNQVITDKELQVRLFNSFIRNTFISGENTRWQNGQPVNEPVRYRLGPSFYFFKNNFYSEDYPAINAVFESHLQKVVQPGPPGGFQDFYGGLPENDRANLILKKYSFNELLQKNPEGDTIRIALTIKGDWFFNFLRANAGIEEFNKWFLGYTDDHKFLKVDIKQFDEDVKAKFGFEFYPYLKDWFYNKQQPGFIINNLRTNELVIDDRSRYQVTFNVSNPESVAGLINISFRTEATGKGPAGDNAMMSYEGGGFMISLQGRGMETSDITKIIFLDSLETKKIGILLDFQPRAMMVNTLFSKNIPGQITLPTDEIIKVKGSARPFEGEEKIQSLPHTDQGEIIVDNEDKGFYSGVQLPTSPLKKILGIHNSDGGTYESVRMYGIPEYWQPVVQSSYYGKYVLSSVYTRAGAGDKSVRWTAAIPSPGYYDVYCYVGKSVDRMTVRTDRGPDESGDSPYKDMHYKVFHDEGVDEITVDFQNADGGWNNLGRYYISSDSAKVELTNKSQGRVVLGDAVRWVRQE